MRFLYFAVAVKRGDKMVAYTIRKESCINLVGIFDDYEFAIYRSTKKQAQETAEAWNATFKKSGILWDGEAL